MTYDEAFRECIYGAWVRPVDLQEGAWISYNFDGLRINFPSGSSSGWHASEADMQAVWQLIGPPDAPITKSDKRDKWGKPL